MVQATWTIVTGRLDAVEELALAACAEGNACGAVEADVVLAAQLIQVRGLQGRLHELEPLVQSLPIPAGRATYAQICLGAGRRDEAAAVLDAVLDDPQAGLHEDVTWAFTVGMLAEVAAGLEDRDRCARLEAMLLPFAGQHVAHSTYYLGPIAHHLGRLRAGQGDLDGAVARADEAAAQAEAMGAPAHLARIQLAGAEARIRRGDRRAGARLARRSRDAARAHGLDHLAAALDALA
jgi:hypothetical protein